MKPSKKSATLRRISTSTDGSRTTPPRPSRPKVTYGDLCRRSPGPKECTAFSVGADNADIAALQIARYFFVSFTTPQSQAWMKAFEAGETLFDPQNGPVIASLTCKLLTAIRQTRRSGFAFNAPDCPGCSAILTEHERRMITALIALREQRIERAELELMMLCEGNDTGKVMLWMRELALALPVRGEEKPLRPSRLN